MLNRNNIKSDLADNFQILKEAGRYFNTYYPGKYKHNIILLNILFILLIGCSSAPPSKTLPHAEVAVAGIDHRNYKNLVAIDVENAKNKLHQAQSAATNKEHEVSENLSQQLLVDVELIQIKSQRISMENEVKTFESNITNLHQELQWREPVQVSPLDN